MQKSRRLGGAGNEATSHCGVLATRMIIEFYCFVGCKINNVVVVYTPFDNPKKTQGMDVGQVGFHDQKRVSCS